MLKVLKLLTISHNVKKMSKMNVPITMKRIIWINRKMNNLLKYLIITTDLNSFVNTKYQIAYFRPMRIQILISK